MGRADVGITPCETTNAAYDAIMCSGQEGSRFPYALAEAFHTAGLYVSIHMDVVMKSEIFPGSAPNERMLITTVTPDVLPETYLHKPSYTVYTNMADLCEIRTAGRRGFHAADTAKEFVRLYQSYYGA